MRPLEAPRANESHHQTPGDRYAVLGADCGYHPAMSVALWWSPIFTVVIIVLAASLRRSK
jgi:hypothetical protein